MTLLGGGCTILWLGMATGSGSNGGLAALINPLFLGSFSWSFWLRDSTLSGPA